jgi:undecaprenyl-diphosphatase
MNFLEAFFLGIVEGITEFLPISSTAHLIIFSEILNISSDNFTKFFEVFIQTGAVLSVVILYTKYILKNKKLLSKILISFIVTSLVAVPFYKVIKNVFFESGFLIIFNFLFIGIVFLIAENLISRKILKLNKDLKNLDITQAILIGLAQGFSIMPGVSRAGAVILAMLFLKYKREEAVVYYFLLAVPTIIAAGFFDLYKVGVESILTSNINLVNLVIGFFSSFFSAFLVIQFFIRYLQKNDLKVFGYYRLIFGLLLFIFFQKLLL